MGLGKWIITGLGWTLFGPLGGLVGYLVGGGIENLVNNNGRSIGAGTGGDTFSESDKYAAGGSRRYHNTGTSEDLSAALLVLIAAMMNADNVVRKSELDLVKRFLVSNYGEAKAKEMLLKLRDLTGKEIPVTEVCRQIKHNTDYTTRYHMLDFLFSIADSDGMISRDELLLLHTISSSLGIATRDYLSIKSRHRDVGTGGGWFGGGQEGGKGSGYSSGTGDYDSVADDSVYAVLGLDSSATDDEVKKAYRRLAMKYHPDRVENLGEEVRRNAEEQFKRINQAYETIKAARGMK